MTRAPEIEWERLAADVAALGAVGATENGGVTRLAFTDADRAGRDWVKARMRALGLEVRVDAVGNLFGVRAGREETAPVMTGSHIDTVVDGGRLDGAFGVLAGLEVVAALDAAGARTRRPLAVAAFSNEEGVRHQPDMMGSLAFAGGLTVEDVHAIAGADGRTIREELAAMGDLGADDVADLRPHAFVELHIEQGPVLEAAGEDVGVVEGVQGIVWTEYVFEGAANHAGTTPFAMRRDAGACATALAKAAHDRAAASGGALLTTVGELTLAPGVVNVVPRRARMTLDVRAPDAEVLRTSVAALDDAAERIAGAAGVGLTRRRLVDFAPVRFDAALCDTIEAAAAARGARLRRMTSGAGHDAQMIARMAPAAMIFTPSIGGVSHSPREATDARHLRLGAEILCDVLVGLAES